jgi:hypothetical protein
MATQVQFRGGTTSEHSTFTGAAREVTVDTTKKTVIVHDGSTVGGIPLAKESAVTSAAAITGGSINGTTVGASTASTGAFTTLSASSTVSGTGFSTYLASPPAIGSTAASTGAFTTLSASSTVSGTGFSTYLASPPAIGSTSASTGAFTTLSASSTVSGTGFSTYLASPPAIGGTTASTGKFTSVTNTGLTSGRITYAGASGLLSDSANLTFDGTNLGIGVTPSVWNSGYKVLQFSNSGAVFGATGDVYLGNNVYANSSDTNTYITTGFASMYRQVSGTHIWYTTTSGTAGNPITFTNAMSLDADGDLGIGATSPVAKLHIKGSGTSGQVTASWILENSSSGTLGMDITGSPGASYARFLYGGGPSTGTNALTETMRIGLEGASVGVQQIKFAATQVPSADANTLDDYEEGTWTPNQGSGLTVVGSFSSTAFYTKTGRMVTVTGRLQGSTSISLAVNGQLCSNLPFTAINTAASTSGGGIAYDSAPTTGIIIFTNSNSTALVGAAVAIPASGTIYFSATYTAAS